MSESRPDSDIVIGVFFYLFELPDDLNAFCVIDQDALNGIIQMLSEFIIRQAAHPSDRLLLRCCREALLMVGFILSFAFIKLLFQGSLFCCEDILACKIFLSREFTFTVLFILGKLLSTASIVLRLE